MDFYLKGCQYNILFQMSTSGNFFGNSAPGHTSANLTHRGSLQLKSGSKKMSGKVIQPAMSNPTEMEEYKHHTSRDHTRSNVFQPKTQEQAALQYSQHQQHGQPDPMAPNYETSNMVKYTSQQRDPVQVKQVALTDRPMFSRESVGSGLGPSSNSVYPQAPTNPAAIQTRAISPVTLRQSMPQSYNLIADRPPHTSPQDLNNIIDDSLNNNENSETLLPSQHQMQHPQQPNVKTISSKKHVIVHLQSKTGRSSQQDNNNTGLPGRVKKLKVIKADALKLVKQDGINRIGSAQGNHQVISLAQQPSSSNIVTELHRKALKIAKPSNTISLTKLKSQITISNHLGQDGSLSFRDLGSNAKQAPRRSVIKVNKKGVQMSSKINASFQAEAPLQEALPQAHISTSIHEDMRHSDSMRSQPVDKTRQTRQFLSVKDLTDEADASNVTSGAKASKRTNNKDSSNFNDIEEKVQQEIAPGEDDSGWFTTNPSANGQIMTKTPIKGIQQTRSGDDSSQLYEAEHMRGMTASTDIKALQQKSLYLDQATDDEAPIIKRIPDSGISQRSRQKNKGQQHQRNMILSGENLNRSRVSQPSDRISEMTDDQMAANNTLMMQSLESLRSNESNTSLKNVFSQSQKITNIAARYIHIQDEHQKNNNILQVQDVDKGTLAESQHQLISRQKVKSALDNQGTPRFNKQVLKNSGKTRMRKKKSAEGSKLLNDSFNRERNQHLESLKYQVAGTTSGKQFSLRHQVPIANDHRLKIGDQNDQIQYKKQQSGLRSVKMQEADELSGTQDENSISSMSQQKDMKSLLGILQRHTRKRSDQGSNHNQSNKSTNIKESKKTKMQLSKLSDNLYNGDQSYTGLNMNSQYQGAQGALPLTPNSAGNTMVQTQGFGSSNSQQSRSFNVGMQSLRGHNSKKKLQTAKQSTVSQWKQQNGLIKNTLTKALIQQQKSNNAQGSKTKQQNNEVQLIASKGHHPVSSIKPSGTGAQSQREKSGLHMLLQSAGPTSSSNRIQDQQTLQNKVNQLASAENSQISYSVKESTTTSHQLPKKKVNPVSLKQPKSNNESQRQKLFQKQLSQTIRLTGISSGISPKASGDLPLEIASEVRLGESQTFFQLRAATTSAMLSKAHPISLNNGSKLDSRLVYKQESSEVKDSFIVIGEESPFKSDKRSEIKIDIQAKEQSQLQIQTESSATHVRSSASPYRIRDPSPRINPKQLIDEEGLGPMPALSERYGLSSVNTLKQIESIKMVIREEKAAQRHNNQDKFQQPLSQQKMPQTIMSNLMPSQKMRKQTSSPPQTPQYDQTTQNSHSPFAQQNLSDGQPFQLYQSKPFQEKPYQERAHEQPELDEGEDDNVSEMMQTFLANTDRSYRHPVAHFNESHPTQQIQGMSRVKKNPVSTTSQADIKNMTSRRTTKVLHSQNSPGDRIERAYQASYQHMKSRQREEVSQVSKVDPVSNVSNQDQDAVQLLVGNGLVAQSSKEMEEISKQYLGMGEHELLPNDMLLRAESIQSMSNVVDKEPIHQINKIQKGKNKAINTQVHLRNASSSHNQVQKKPSRNQEQYYQNIGTSDTRRIVLSDSSSVKKLKARKRNFLVMLLEDGLLREILKFLLIKHCLPLKSVLKTKPLLQMSNLMTLYEREFVAYLDYYRCFNPSSGGESSLLCKLITKHFQSTMLLQTAQDEVVFQKVALKLRAGRVTMKQAQIEAGVAFEIEKDVDRTFQDQTKFTEAHRLGLSIVLRTIAELEKDVGYVQGLNFIVANLLILMEHKKPRDAQRFALVSFFTIMRQLETREFYTEKMLGLKEAIFKLECMLYNEMPEVFLFLLEKSISVEYFASQWFLTLFQYDIEDVEQSGIITLMALIFGQKIFFQIAFQLIQTIRSKLCLMSFEKALIYLKDFAGEPYFRTSEFLSVALTNHRITDGMLAKLSLIYAQMAEKGLHSPSHQNQTPLAMQVKFLRGSKIIWVGEDGMQSKPSVQNLTIDRIIRFNENNQNASNKAAIVNHKPIISGKVQRSPTNVADSSFEEIDEHENFVKEADATLDSEPNSTPKMQQLHSSASSLKVFSRPSRYERSRQQVKGGSLSPQKQQINLKNNGFTNFFFKLNPFAASKAQQQQNNINNKNNLQNSVTHSSEESKQQFEDTQAFAEQQEPNQILNQEEGTLLSSHRQEKGAREPPLFMSPQTAYRKYQKTKVQQHQSQHHRRATANSALLSSQEYLLSTSHRSPRVFQPTLKQSSENWHRKTATGTFNSRAVQYPEGASIQNHDQLLGDDSLLTKNKQSKKPSQQQKKKFAEILNLEKLNFQKVSKVSSSSGRHSRTKNTKPLSSRPESGLKTNLINYIQAPSENIPESEQKEQKVNNISLYGSTNPKNLKMTKKRQEVVQKHRRQNKEKTYKSSESPPTPLQDMTRSVQGLDWDEDDVMIRSDRLPKLPISAQTGLIAKNYNRQQQTNSSKQLMKEKMIRQFKMSQSKTDARPANNERRSKKQLNVGYEIGSSLNQNSSQESLSRIQSQKSIIKMSQRFQQDLLKSKDTKLMGTLNQSLEETKQVVYNEEVREPRRSTQADQLYSRDRTVSVESKQDLSGYPSVLKESRSHDRGAMLTQLTAAGVITATGRANPKDKSLSNRQRIFEAVMGTSSGQHHSFAKASKEAMDLENLDELEEENFADGRIPQANISNYNSHQSHNKLAFQSKLGLMNYASSGSNALEETFVVGNANNIVLRQELRNSKLQSHNVSSESSLKGDNEAFLDNTYHSAGALGPNSSSAEDDTQAGLLKHIKASARAAVLGSGSTRHNQQLVYYGKTSVQRQSMQVRGHKGDKLFEDQAL